MIIERMRGADWDEVRAIYEEGIAGGNATFEAAAPAWEAWDRAPLAEPRIVAREKGAADGEAGHVERDAASSRILGWAALSAVSERCVYAGVAEVSVYVAAAARGRGVGRALLEELILRSEREGLWTLQAGIFPENEASLFLHCACGFRLVGRRERLGKLGGAWRDVLLLERRSERVGRE